MPERRQAFRPEPVELEFSDGFILSIGPVPWPKRNDFGNEVIQQYVENLNEAVRAYIDTETGTPQLVARMGEKFTDPATLLRLGLLPGAFEQIEKRDLYFQEVVQILLAICDVNDLKKLRPLIDPNLETPTLVGGSLSPTVEEGTNSPKIESGPDSSSPELTAP